MSDVIKCEDCGEEKFTCCGSGTLRCETCDGPCPDCYSGGPGDEDTNLCDTCERELVECDDDSDHEPYCPMCCDRCPDCAAADEPGEDDYKTEDHRHFYQYGKLVVTVPEEHDWEPYIKAHMLKQQFFPSVFSISDHGNTCLCEWDFDKTDVDQYNYEKVASRLTRDQCVTLLESVGIECYDDESQDTLQEAVRANLEDRTLNLEDLPK